MAISSEVPKNVLSVPQPFWQAYLSGFLLPVGIYCRKQQKTMAGKSPAEKKKEKVAVPKRPAVQAGPPSQKSHCKAAGSRGAKPLCKNAAATAAVPKEAAKDKEKRVNTPGDAPQALGGGNQAFATRK